MRAERAGRHLSGAERLLSAEQLETAATDMLERALQHPRGRAERIFLRVEQVAAEQIERGHLLDLHNNLVADWQQGRELAQEMLLAAGVSREAVTAACAQLAAGASPCGGSMRGAMLVDADSGERLENDQARGVRVSRMDLSTDACRQLRGLLADQQLDNPHVREALILASKVALAPGLVAELCWSDDPDYVAGYVASAKAGYQRISMLKPCGEERGGRAFFIRSGRERLAALIDWLEKKPLLFDRVGRINAPRRWMAER